MGDWLAPLVIVPLALGALALLMWIFYIIGAGVASLFNKDKEGKERWGRAFVWVFLTWSLLSLVFSDNFF
jgi:hypothetical protein